MSDYNALFPWSGAAQIASIGVSTAKSWAGSKSKRAELLLFSVLLCWGNKRSERVPKRWSYALPFIDWSTESSLLCDGDKTNKHSTRKVFLDNGESFLNWRKCNTKVCRPFRTSSIVALCSLCCALLFHWIY